MTGDRLRHWASAWWRRYPTRSAAAHAPAPAGWESRAGSSTDRTGALRVPNPGPSRGGNRATRLWVAMGVAMGRPGSWLVARMAPQHVPWEKPAVAERRTERGNRPPRAAWPAVMKPARECREAIGHRVRPAK